MPGLFFRLGLGFLDGLFLGFGLLGSRRSFCLLFGLSLLFCLLFSGLCVLLGLFFNFFLCLFDGLCFGLLFCLFCFGGLFDDCPVGCVEWFARCPGHLFGSQPAGLPLFDLFVFQAFSQEYVRDRIGGDGAFVQPVFHSLEVEHDLAFRLLFERVVMAQLFENSAVTRRTRVNGVDSEERPMPSSHTGHSDFYCHN